MWTVHVLGQSSTPFPGDLKYGRPTLLSLDDVATPTQAEGIRVITGLHFARLHALTHTQLLYRGEEVTRVSLIGVRVGVTVPRWSFVTWCVAHVCGTSGWCRSAG